MQKMISAGSNDPFVFYAFAMELRSLGRLDESLTAFESLRSKDAQYVPQYLMAAQVADQLGRKAVAREWLEQGLLFAQKKGDSKAVGEIQSMLDSLVVA